MPVAPTQPQPGWSAYTAAKSQGNRIWSTPSHDYRRAASDAPTHTTQRACACMHIMHTCSLRRYGGRNPGSPGSCGKKPGGPIFFENFLVRCMQARGAVPAGTRPPASCTGPYRHAPQNFLAFSGAGIFWACRYAGPKFLAFSGAGFFGCAENFSIAVGPPRFRYPGVGVGVARYAPSGFHGARYGRTYACTHPAQNF